MDFDRKYRRMMERHYDSLEEGYARLAKSATASLPRAFNYLLDGMKEVSPEMARRAGGRVKNELNEAFSTREIRVEFDFQGSTTNGTNIKKNSDIDLLVAHGECFTAAPGTHVAYPNYSGDVTQEILDIRSACIEELRSRYWASTVSPGSKSIKISGGSLERAVDVVPCNWYRNAAYERQPSKVLLGIRVRDTESDEWIHNFPFLHNELLELRDRECGGNLRGLIRLLKNLREDADAAIDVSSYEIAGLVYSMGPEALRSGLYDSVVDLAERLLGYLSALASNSVAQTGLKFPNGHGHIFRPKGSLLPTELKKLNSELEYAVRQARAGLRPLTTKFPTLAELLSVRN